MRVEKDTTARGRADNTTAFIIICIAIATDSVIVTKEQYSTVSDIKKRIPKLKSQSNAAVSSIFLNPVCSL